MDTPAVTHHYTSTGLDSKKLAMWAFIGSECMLFGALISGYLVYKGRSVVGPTPDEILNIPVTTVSTFVLLWSSLCMVLALSGLVERNMTKAKLWTFLTALGGLIFLGFQYYEFSSFVHEGLGLTTNLFASTFYTLTGTHGTHVAVGVLILGTCWVQMLRGKFGPERADVLEVAGLYWHFVDVIWIVIFTLIYLLK